jgi:TonB-linked SusC/RagA family outer membrane protein
MTRLQAKSAMGRFYAPQPSNSFVSKVRNVIFSRSGKFLKSFEFLIGTARRSPGKACILQLLFFSIFFMYSSLAVAQTSPVKGRVNNDAGEPMAGATIVIKGKNTSVTTSEDGTFSINASAKDVIIVTSVGYETREITVGNQTSLTVLLTTKTSSMNEVVVVGYGSQNRREVTGSITKIDNKVLAAVPVSSFDAALQGRAAGVQVIQSTGMAGAGTQIRIRGTGSITAGGEPLYVIDGIPISANSGQTIGAVNANPLSSINSADIESIEILKDASAAAIYGSRGANGVIIITTKRGKKGKPQVSATSRLAFSNLTRKPDLLNSEEFVGLYKEAVANDYKFNPTGAPASRALPGNVAEADALKTNTDWVDPVSQTGVSTFNDVSVSAGGNKLKVYVGLSYLDEQSFLVNDHFNRSSARMNIDYTPAKFIKIGANVSYAYTDQNLIPVGFAGGYGRSISNALPYFPVYNTDGSFSKTSVFNNPVAEINNATRQLKGGRTFASLFTDVTIIKNLSLRLEGNLDYSDNKLYQLTTQVLSTAPVSRLDRSFLANWNNKALLNYSLDLDEKHSFKFMVGTEMLKNETNSKSHIVTFVPGQEDWLFNDPTLPAETNPNGTPNTNNRRTTNAPSEYSFFSYFGRLNYSFLDRYLLTATVRRDGSSRFGVNNKFGAFPAISAGWILSDEAFMKNIKALTFLKLKAGYGLTGNAEIPNYAQWGVTNVQNTQIYNGEQFWTITSLANPDLRWETTKKFDLAIEYGLFDNRITGELAYYVNNSEDLFLGIRTTTSTGFGSVLANVGKVRNKGLEFSISSRNIVKQHFSWTTDFNIARNTNKVVDIGTQGPDALGGTGDTRVIVGKPIGSNYLVKTLYIDPQDGMPVYEMLDPNTKQVAGVTKQYNAQRDRQVVGSPYPDFFGGIDNRFTWKKFDFGFTATFQVGGNIFDDAEKFQMNSIGAWNPKTKVLDRWQKPGDVTSVPRMTLGLSGITQVRNTTEFLHDASYFRMKVISAGFRLPDSFIRKLKMTNARIGLAATNIFTISNYDGDPEVLRDLSSAQQRNVSPNVTYLTAPQSRTFTLSLNLNF